MSPQEDNQNTSQASSLQANASGQAAEDSDYELPPIRIASIVDPEKAERKLSKILVRAVNKGRELTQREQDVVYMLLRGTNLGGGGKAIINADGSLAPHAPLIYSEGGFGLAYTDASGQVHNFSVKASEQLHEHLAIPEAASNEQPPVKDIGDVVGGGNGNGYPPEFKKGYSDGSGRYELPLHLANLKERSPERLQNRLSKILSRAVSKGYDLTQREQDVVYMMLRGTNAGGGGQISINADGTSAPNAPLIYSEGGFSLSYTDSGGKIHNFSVKASEQLQEHLTIPEADPNDKPQTNDIESIVAGGTGQPGDINNWRKNAPYGQQSYSAAGTEVDDTVREMADDNVPGKSNEGFNSPSNFFGNSNNLPNLKD